MAALRYCSADLAEVGLPAARSGKARERRALSHSAQAAGVGAAKVTGLPADGTISSASLHKEPFCRKKQRTE